MERSTQGVVENTKLSDAAGSALGDIDRVNAPAGELIEQISGKALEEARSANIVPKTSSTSSLVTEQTGEGTRSTAQMVRETSRARRGTQAIGGAFQDCLIAPSRLLIETDAMDAPQTPRRSTTLSALAWCRMNCAARSRAAAQAMRRHLKEAEALAGRRRSVDPGVLRAARAQLHQGVGALEAGGSAGRRELLRAEERIAEVERAPCDAQRRRGRPRSNGPSFALLDYLARLLADKPIRRWRWFPPSTAQCRTSGVDRIHPADLCCMDWQWHEIAPTSMRHPGSPTPSWRSEVEVLTLALMRQAEGPAAATLSELFAGLAAGGARE